MISGGILFPGPARYLRPRRRESWVKIAFYFNCDTKLICEGLLHQTTDVHNVDLVSNVYDDTERGLNLHLTRCKMSRYSEQSAKYTHQKKKDPRVTKRSRIFDHGRSKICSISVCRAWSTCV